MSTAPHTIDGRKISKQTHQLNNAQKNRGEVKIVKQKKNATNQQSYTHTQRFYAFMHTLECIVLICFLEYFTQSLQHRKFRQQIRPKRSHSSAHVLSFYLFRSSQFGKYCVDLCKQNHIIAYQTMTLILILKRQKIDFKTNQLKSIKPYSIAYALLTINHEIKRNRPNLFWLF